MLGETVTVTIDRPLGTYHPERKEFYYPINYGYIEGVIAPDGEEQDVYVLGVSEPLERFTGTVIALIHRNDDVEEKWVVAPEGRWFSKEEIMEQVQFQEQYFDSWIREHVTEWNVNEKAYRLKKLLGKGKGGYSYLVTDGETEYVLKQIHHEPCSYYQFGNKIEAELNDYQRLQNIGIRLPKLLAVDREQERILKEYIEGATIFELVLADRIEETYFAQMKEMCGLLYAANTNIDYFPTNFVVQEDILYYIDFECNNYMEEWNFENWGVKYWSKSPEFLQYVKEHEK